MFDAPLNSPKILVFDSGAGGLTIAKEILAYIPHCHLIFAADNAYFPYGLKEDDLLTSRIVQQVEHYHEVIQPDLVVVACNTASTLALDILREEFNCPFVGVVPAIKPAAKISKTGTIGVLATPATVAREYTRQLIRSFAPDHTVLLQGSDKLVNLAERKILNEEYEQQEVNDELEALFAQRNANKIDTVVLACTHFPILKDELDTVTKLMGKQITWVDSGNAIARRVHSLLENELTNTELSQHIEVFTSATNNEGLEESYKAFLAS